MPAARYCKLVPGFAKICCVRGPIRGVTIAVSADILVAPILLLLVMSMLITPVLSIVIYGMAGWTVHKQTLYDKFADCRAHPYCWL